MPSLQIKECPIDVYDALKLCAVREDRSMAQQALHIIREYLKTYSNCRMPETAEYRHCGDEVQERIRSRERLLASVSRRKQIDAVPEGFGYAAGMIRADHEGVRSCSQKARS